MLLRTHVLTEAILCQARAIASHPQYKIVLAVDNERLGHEQDEFDTMVLSREGFHSLGLRSDLRDVFWRCGDYPLYVARAKYPGCKRFWQYEYDVVLNHRHPGEFLAKIDRALSEDDFLSTYIREAEDSWFFKQAMQGRYPNLFACYFPLVRISSSAIDFLRQRRVLDGDRDGSGDWPNDEVFVATELINNGFRCADLASYGNCYSKATFAFDVLFHNADLPEPDGLIYHMVRSGAQYARKMEVLKDDADLLGIWRRLKHEGVDDRSLAFGLSHLVKKEASIGDDPGRLLGPGSRLGSFLLDSGYSAVPLQVVSEAFASQRLAFSLALLRRVARTAGVELPATLRNVALAMPAWQSTTSRWSRVVDVRGDAQGGNDGQISQDCGFHTGWSEEPFWAVDLLDLCEIREMRIFNRVTFWQRLSGFRVSVSVDGWTWREVYSNDPQIDSVEPQGSHPLRVLLTTTARLVKIHVPRRDCLHLREVQIDGVAVAPAEARG